MSVYFLREGDFIKIGFSNDVRSRTAAIINGLRGRGELLGYMPGGREVEKHLHTTFAADHEYGEWFKVTPRLLALIETVNTTEPPRDERHPADRLLMQEERYAEEAAYFIRHALSDLTIDASTFTVLERSTAIPAERLRAIYDGLICPITAGEYVVLRMLDDAARGITPEDHEAAVKAAKEWAEKLLLDRTGTQGRGD